MWNSPETVGMGQAQRPQKHMDCVLCASGGALGGGGGGAPRVGAQHSQGPAERCRVATGWAPHAPVEVLLWNSLSNTVGSCDFKKRKLAHLKKKVCEAFEPKI